MSESDLSPDLFGFGLDPDRAEAHSLVDGEPVSLGEPAAADDYREWWPTASPQQELMEDGRQSDQQRISALERRVGALERELQELRQSVIDNSNIRIQHASASASTTPVNTSNNDSHANINAISERNGSAEDGAEPELQPRDHMCRSSREPLFKFLNATQTQCRCLCQGETGIFRARDRCAHFETVAHQNFVRQQRYFCCGEQCHGERLQRGANAGPPVVCLKTAECTEKACVSYKGEHAGERNVKGLCKLCGGVLPAASFSAEQRASKRRRRPPTGDEAVIVKLAHPTAGGDEQWQQCNDDLGPGVFYLTYSSDSVGFEMHRTMPSTGDFSMCVLPVLNRCKHIVNYDCANGHVLGETHAPATREGHVDVFAIVPRHLLDCSVDADDLPTTVSCERLVTLLQTNKLDLYATGDRDGWLVVAARSQDAMGVSQCDAAVPFRARIDAADWFDADKPRLLLHGNAADNRLSEFDSDPNSPCEVAEAGEASALRRWPRLPAYAQSAVGDSLVAVQLLVYVENTQDVKFNPRSAFVASLQVGQPSVMKEYYDTFTCDWLLKRMSLCADKGVCAISQLVVLACRHGKPVREVELLLAALVDQAGANIDQQNDVVRSAAQQACHFQAERCESYVEVLLDKTRVPADTRSYVLQCVLHTALRTDCEALFSKTLRRVEHVGASQDQNDLLSRALACNAQRCISQLLSQLQVTPTDAVRRNVLLSQARNVALFLENDPLFRNWLLSEGGLALTLPKLTEDGLKVMEMLLEKKLYHKSHLDDALTRVVDAWLERRTKKRPTEIGSPSEESRLIVRIVELLHSEGAQLCLDQGRLTKLLRAGDWLENSLLVSALNPILDEWPDDFALVLACFAEDRDLAQSVASKLSADILARYKRGKHPKHNDSIVAQQSHALLLCALRSKCRPDIVESIVRRADVQAPDAFFFALGRDVQHHCCGMPVNEQQRRASLDALMEHASDEILDQIDLCGDVTALFAMNARDRSPHDIRKTIGPVDYKLVEYFFERLLGDTADSCVERWQARLAPLLRDDSPLPKVPNQCGSGGVHSQSFRSAHSILYSLAYRGDGIPNPERQQMRARVASLALKSSHVSFHATLGRWMLQLAVERGEVDLAVALLDHEAVDVTMDCCGSSIWNAQARYCDPVILRKLLSIQELDIVHESDYTESLAICGLDARDGSRHSYSVDDVRLILNDRRCDFSRLSLDACVQFAVVLLDLRDADLLQQFLFFRTDVDGGRVAAHDRLSPRSIEKSASPECAQVIANRRCKQDMSAENATEDGKKSTREVDPSNDLNIAAKVEHLLALATRSVERAHSNATRRAAQLRRDGVVNHPVFDMEKKFKKLMEDD